MAEEARNSEEREEKISLYTTILDASSTGSRIEPSGSGEDAPGQETVEKLGEEERKPHSRVGGIPGKRMDRTNGKERENGHERESTKCELCDKICKSRAGLAIHSKWMHNVEEKEFTCGNWGAIFNQKTNLKNHEESCRGETSPTKYEPKTKSCDRCKKNDFTLKSGPPHQELQNVGSGGPQRGVNTQDETRRRRVKKNLKFGTKLQNKKL